MTLAERTQCSTSSITTDMSPPYYDGSKCNCKSSIYLGCIEILQPFVTMFMTDLVIDIVISVVIAIFSAYINPVISHIIAWCIFHINPSISPNSRGALRLDITWLRAGHSRPIHPGVLHLSEESRMGYGMRTLDSPYRRRRFQWHLSSTPPWRQAFRKWICKLGGPSFILF